MPTVLWIGPCRLSFETIAHMGTIITVAVYLFGALFFVYLIVCEFLDTIGRLEIVEAKWPRLYKAMSNRPMRLALLVFLIFLVGRDLVERAKERIDVPTLAVTTPAPPAPVVQMLSTPPAPSSAKQTLVENHGQISGGTISGNTQISGTNTPHQEVAIHVGTGVKGNVPNIENMNFCSGDDWNCFLNAERVYATGKDTTAFENLVNTFSDVVSLRGRGMAMRGNSLGQQQCIQEFRDSVDLLRSHMQNESGTIESLRSKPPICLKQP